MSLSYRPGITQALNLLDSYPADRDPLEVLTEYRQMLVKELDDNLPTLKEVQDWMSRVLYQNHGNPSREELERRAKEELGMDFRFTHADRTGNGKLIAALTCKRRTVNITLEPTKVPPRGQMSEGRERLQITAINVEE
ncbi:hypothetical protein Voja6_00071 [Pseudomonas phage vB_PpuM-Voja-6]